jgi:hypothetical protein
MIGDFPFMLSFVEAFITVFQQNPSTRPVLSEAEGLSTDGQSLSFSVISRSP